MTGNEHLLSLKGISAGNWIEKSTYIGGTNMRMRSKISALVRQCTWKLFPQSETVRRYEVFKSIEPHKMDAELLGTLIRHYAHILDKITKRRRVGDRRSIYYDKLTEAIKTWPEKNVDASDDILWAEQILKQYLRWEREKKQARSIAIHEKKDKGNLYEIIRQRRSIRYFEKRDIEREKILKILEAGRWAPCSGNRQAWKFIVQRRIQGTYIAKEELSFESEAWRRGSVMIYVAIDERLYPEKYTAAMDAAAAIQNMLLMAYHLDLGGCWMYLSEIANQNKLRKKLGLEDYYYVYSTILLGYPAEFPKGPKRKPLEKAVKFIGFDLNDGDNDA